MGSRSTTAFFIIDGKGLEAQALLLAATLYRYNANDPLISLMAYGPPESLDALAPITRAVLGRTGVDCAPLPPAGELWKAPYPHGNKILACCAERGTARSVFLDTDVICCAPLAALFEGPEDAVHLVPEGIVSWGKRSDRWERAYAYFGLEIPTDRVRLTRRKRREFLPYFNAGMIAFSDTAAAGGTGFAELWRDTASEFDWNAPIGGKRPWLDQITLPLTLKRFGIGYHALGDVWNFSISNRPHEPDTEPRLIHYHRGCFLEAWPQAADALAALRALLAPEETAQAAELLAAGGFARIAAWLTRPG